MIEIEPQAMQRIDQTSTTVPTTIGTIPCVIVCTKIEEEIVLSVGRRDMREVGRNGDNWFWSKDRG